MNSLQSLVERKLLPFVEKPLRYAGGELNMVRKDLATVTLHGVLCFPDLYDLGMSHLGLQILYYRINRNPRWALSRCFAPWSDAEQLMREHAIPLYSLEYFTALREADWVGFSVQYELQYTNIVTMLDLGGIPVESRNRRADDPLVIAGGPCTGNPEPLAEYIDAFAIGDGEQTIVRIAEVLERGKRESLPREERLKLLTEVPGVYVPSRFPVTSKGRFVVPESAAYPAVFAAKVPELLPEYYPEKPLVPLMDVVHHRLGLEVMRGCTHGCRFCSAGMYYRPVREKSPGALLSEIENGIAATGWRDVGLMSLSTADYSCLTPLLAGSQSLKERYRVAFSLPSTRIDALDPSQIDRFTAVSPMTALTIAPEAGSERLRRVINKDFTDETIFATVDTLLSRNVQTIKLYFMIGLPTEKDEDIAAIIAMVSNIAARARAVSHRRSVHVSLSPFSPKPHTPFQWEAMESAESLDAKNRAIKNALRHLKNVKVSYRRIETTQLETVMARGDRALSPVILAAWKKGARFDGWDDQFRYERWTEAAREVAVDFSAYLSAIPPDQKLPWAVLSTGVSTEFLAAERDRAMHAEITADCRSGVCLACGVCDGGISHRLSRSQMDAVPERTAVTYGRAAVRKEHEELRYRFIYSKGAPVRFLGHLDMVAVFVRALVASGCRIAFSHGFQPHPRVSFGPPLACGIVAEAEAFDVSVIARINVAPESINAMLPEGLRIRQYGGLRSPHMALNAAIVAAVYRYVPLDPLDPVYLEERVAAVREAKTLPIHVVKHEKPSLKDIRPLIRSMAITDGNTVTATLQMEPGATCKPGELIRALFPEKAFTDFLVTRECCLVRGREGLVPLRLQE